MNLDLGSMIVRAWWDWTWTIVGAVESVAVRAISVLETHAIVPWTVADRTT